MEKILLVDDIFGEGESPILVDYLRPHGYLVICATNAKDAWEKINRGSYEAIIIDGSEDSAVRQHYTLSEMVAEYFPNTKRISFSGENIAIHDPHLRKNYDHIVLKGMECAEDLLKALKETKTQAKAKPFGI
ncbi:hypothetical protein HOA91_03875 [Candidatus Woesearchaeota archaeon]|jgi:CheY-like chemotaxis protein|nr:hypothetical protein [Candidatus Woesearchaeota archaeon]